MRIVHVSDVFLPRLGGLEVQVHDLAHQQALAGHDVQVITATESGPGAPGGPGDPAGSDDLVHVVRTPRLGPLTWDDVLGPRPDVLHVHTSLVSPLAWSAARAATR